MTLTLAWRDGLALFENLWVGSATKENDVYSHIVGWSEDRPWRAFALLADRDARGLGWFADEAEARAAVETAVDSAIGDERYPDWLYLFPPTNGQPGVKQREEGYRLRERAMDEANHLQNVLAAAFDITDDATNLGAFIIDNFAPAGFEDRIGAFGREWLAKERARKADPELRKYTDG